MNYRTDKLMIDGHTDTHTYTHTHTQATTIPEGQNWPRVKTWFKFVTCDKNICSYGMEQKGPTNDQTQYQVQLNQKINKL